MIEVTEDEWLKLNNEKYLELQDRFIVDLNPRTIDIEEKDTGMIMIVNTDIINQAKFTSNNLEYILHHFDTLDKGDFRILNKYLDY